ncbi:putative RNA methylase involved in rRNA processing [Trachipleistophora hominis]|uniref:Ribosomal RNA-processing protein 8 n=1 Tax=Trachipleistophora hominis TaxID=72359 RepID=L7JZK0_TRAHO|nr:putative RNA methylase involved in rRNA processing [Trachipleistophora hominis]
MSSIRKYEKRLEGAKFRIINELMYKNEKIEPEQLLEYHIGYRSQTQKWPVNPIDTIIEHLKTKEYSKIADVGCGEALLAQKIAHVDSYDYYPINESIIKSDINEIKCEDAEYECAVYCLSLMKNNVGAAMKECNRIVKVGGCVVIAEVLSRISSLNEFYTQMLAMGFKKNSVLASNDFFIIVEFIKVKDCDKVVDMFLKECVYKKR